MKHSLRWFVAAVFVGGCFVVAPQAEAQSLGAKAQRVRELVQARGDANYLIPAPGSRSTVISVDVSTGLFFFLEHGSIRGPAVQSFYEAIEAGDMEAAERVFTANAILTVRATDYGWNGLGVPWIATNGAEINDILYNKDMGGMFRRADEITDEDLISYEGMLDAVLAALESTT